MKREKMEKENAVDQLTQIVEDTKSDNDPSNAKEVAEAILEEVKEVLQK